MDTTATSTEWIPIAELPDVLPRRGGRKLHVSTAYRWVERGVQGIRLRTISLGAQRVTTREWLAEWAAAVEAARRGETPAPPRKSRQRRTTRTLARHGLGSGRTRD